MKYLIIVPVLLFNFSALSQTKFEISNYPLENEYKTISRDSAELLFKQIKESKTFEFDYTRGGCDYRAHAVYLLLKKQGIPSFKIWNFAASKIWNYSIQFKIPDIDFNQHNLLLTAKDRINLSTESSYYSECGDNVIKSTIYWGYHVAPILLVKNEDKIDTLVVDPAMFNNLVKPKTWLKAQLQEKSNSYYTYLDGGLISFQTSSINTLTGLFYDDEYSIKQKKIEESLSKGKVFVEYYENEIKPLEIELNKYPKDTDSPEAKSLACEIANRKNIVFNELVVMLPIEYKNKFNKYVKEATQYLFEN